MNQFPYPNQTQSGPFVPPQQPQWGQAPVMPQQPQWGQAPAMPQQPQWGQTPVMPQRPQWGQAPVMPQQPQWPQAPVMPQQPQWGQQPAVPQGAPYPAAYAPVVYYPPAYALQPSGDPRLVKAKKSLNFMCLLVLLQTVAIFLWEPVLLMVMRSVRVDVFTDSMAYQWMTAALTPLSTALPFFIYMLVKRKEAGEFLRFEKVGFSTGFLCVMGGLAICLLGNYPAYFIQEFFGQFGYEPAADVFSGETSGVLLFLELFSVAVVVPVMEEFAFRGVLLSVLRRYGTGFAIVTSALVFALVHLDFSNVLFAFFAGLVFGYLYSRTGNLWVSIVIHALNNAIAILGDYDEFLFGPGGSELYQTLLMLVPILLGAAALIAIAVWRRDLLTRKGVPGWSVAEQPLRGGEGASVVVRTPLFWVIVAYMSLYTLTLFL